MQVYRPHPVSGAETMSTTDFDRREFLKTTTVAAGTVAATGTSSNMMASDPGPGEKDAESIVKLLFENLKPEQKKQICFEWDHQDKERGLLRTRVANNWQVTKPSINSQFYTKDQRQMIRDIFESIISPGWQGKIDKQLQDDAGGFGKSQSIAIFGVPGEGKFELVMTGRHMTLRVDGNSTNHMAFGGPIFYGHAAKDFYEDHRHRGNVFWEQALAANKVYQMLSGKQQKMAEVSKFPWEGDVGFKGKGTKLTGIPVTEMSSDQKEELQRVLNKLIEPYRQSDREEVISCLKKQGGLDACSMSFYTDHDMGKDKVWDNWRLEGPSFVWNYRGDPHVHVWVNVADEASVKLNA
ncbi:DUF3500 domain-containing protein [Mariniblastus sp.]|nr:DUF3500 domain-containing protein [Mariniblastus sp.]MDB4756085.1 DUF3500 domain-containing protein [Mariniblastus sp.]